jgi:capsular polysaccharide biosynthesis protein
MNREIHIDLRQCIQTLLTKWWLVAIIAIVAATGVYIATYSVEENIYYAETTAYIVADESVQDAAHNSAMMLTYADIIMSQKVSKRAALLLGNEKVDGEAIQDMIKVDYGNESTVLSITAYSREPQLSIDVANAVANAFLIEVRNTTSKGNLELLDISNSAQTDFDGQSRQTKVRLLVVLLSILITSGIICISAIFSTKIKTVVDARLYEQLDVIGIIPFCSHKAKGGRI